MMVLLLKSPSCHTNQVALDMFGRTARDSPGPSPSLPPSLPSGKPGKFRVQSTHTHTHHRDRESPPPSSSHKQFRRRAGRSVRRSSRLLVPALRPRRRRSPARYKHLDVADRVTSSASLSLPPLAEGGYKYPRSRPKAKPALGKHIDKHGALHHSVGQICRRDDDDDDGARGDEEPLLLLLLLLHAPPPWQPQPGQHR